MDNTNNILGICNIGYCNQQAPLSKDKINIVLEEALKTARVIAKNAPLSIKQVKKSIRYGSQMELKTAFRFEVESYNHLIDTADRIEGVEAFNEKRPAQFKGS